MLHSEVHSTDMQKVDRQKSLLGWHFTIFTCFEWNLGRGPLLLSVDLLKPMYVVLGADFAIRSPEGRIYMNGAIMNSQQECCGLE